MARTSLTSREYELHLKDMCERLKAYLEGGGEDPKHLLKDAENVLELADSFPEVFERYRRVEGLVAAVLARQKQHELFVTPKGPPDSPGCLLFWLLRGHGKTT